MKTIRLASGFYISTMKLNGVVHSGLSFCRTIARQDCENSYKKEVK